MIRQPAVADRFYPGSNITLSRQVSRLLHQPSSTATIQALAAISPHAGYMYSGGVAGETLGAINIPETVIILGLNHHGQGAPIALSLATWEMPMGEVRVNTDLSNLLLQNDSPVTHDEVAHQFEHSVEVQIPFLQALQPNLEIIPIVLSHISYQMCEELGATIAGAITTYKKNVLIVASSDMTHYESRDEATKKDKLALRYVDELDPRGLYDTVHRQRISMCGVIPVTVALIASKALGAKNVNLIRYTDSGEVSGDIDQVVGYAGVIIS